MRTKHDDEQRTTMQQQQQQQQPQLISLPARIRRSWLRFGPRRHGTLSP